MNNGLIKHCSDSGCGWKCCDFGSNGHIALLPNEYETAEGSLSHLKIVNDNDNGGKHVKCTAKDKSNCDGGYKPIQCRTFPLFVKNEKCGAVKYFSVHRSMRCPLDNKMLRLHKKRSIEIVSGFLIKQGFEFYDFFKNVKLNSYKEYNPVRDAFVILDKNNVSDILEYENTLSNDNLCLRSSNEDIEKSLISECSVGVLTDKGIVAYSLCYVNEYGVSFIDKSYVSELYRGNGYQIKTILECLNLAKQKSSFVAYTMVSPENEISIRNLEKCGFEKVKKTNILGYERYILKNESFSR